MYNNPVRKPKRKFRLDPREKPRLTIPAYKLSGLVVALSLLTPVPAAFAQQTPSLRIKSFSVGPDQALTYPDSSSGTNQLAGFADGHTTFLPPVASGAPYLVFGAALAGVSSGIWGAAVLETTDLKTFTFATSLGYNFPVLTSPVSYPKCNPTYDSTWDENYAAPGSVLQDPTLPAGNLIMLIDAEQHCPGGVWQSPFYISVGFARSSDNGKTWPAPEIGALGGPSRHPILQSPEPQPSAPHANLGDGIPAGFVDKSASGDYYLYVAYTVFPSSGTRVARAKLGADPLTFLKWYNGSFSQPGIGGLDSAVTPSAGCTYPENPAISYNDDLGLYLMILKCLGSPAGAAVGGWYYSTATSLDVQDWTTPQIVENSQFPVTAACSADGRGQQFDGWYPSSMSPSAPSGHIKLTGLIFYHNGCDTGKRLFMSRSFSIATESVPMISTVANAEGESPAIAPNTWVEIKGVNLAPAGDSRIWQGSDIVGAQMPTQLDRVSALVNGKSAYVYYISPTQINVLTPPDAMTGPVQVNVTNNGATSSSFTAQAQTLSPSFFVFNGGPYIAAVHGNGSLIGSASLYPGSTTPAKPGETILLYANGFGPTGVPVISGSIMQSGTLSPLPVIKIGGVIAAVQFAGLVLPGEFQFNVVVPSNTPAGDQPITASYGGFSTQAGTLLTIQP